MTDLMLHPERFGYHPDLMHMVIVASHFMRFGFQDDNQKDGIDPSELLDTGVISKTAKAKRSPRPAKYKYTDESGNE